MMTDKIRLGAADLVDVLPTDRVRFRLSRSEQVAVPLARPGDVRSYETELAEFERRLSNALVASKQRVDVAARMLGLGRATMYRKMHSLGMDSQ